MERHLAAGLSKGFGSRSLHLSAMHAFSNKVEGPNTMDAPGTETISLEMNQREVDLGWSLNW